MGASFWLRRFALVFAGALMLIAAVQYMNTGDAAFALKHGTIWATASASVFTAARLWQSRRGQHCAICKDTPEMTSRSE